MENGIYAGVIFIVCGMLLLLFPNAFMKIMRVKAPGRGWYPPTSEEYFGKENARIVMIVLGIIFIAVGLIFLAVSFFS